MIKTNLEKLVDLAVCGTAVPPGACDSGERTAFDGGSFVPLGYPRINHTVKVGDSAFVWAGAQEVEPGVAISCESSDSNVGLTTLACRGNEAILVDAKLEGTAAKPKGAIGTVTGKVSIPAAKVIPGKQMEDGVGSTKALCGDFDIESTSSEALRDMSLDQLRLGDLVAIADIDSTRGPRWQPGLTPVAVVAHGASRQSGHGSGVNVVLTSPKATIEPMINRKANLAELLGLQ